MVLESTPIATLTSPKKSPPTFDLKLEALRGLAALTVVLGHTIITKQTLDPNYQPTGVFDFRPPGHLSVIVFFILSGYVIGLSTKQPLTTNTIGLYLKKRLVRIYPIYLISIGLALLVSPPIPLAKLIGNILFLQVVWQPTLASNAPIWSLHYEILFYLLFIPVSLFRLPPARVCIASFLAGLGILFFSNWPAAALLTSYLFGFSLWSLGLVLSEVFRSNTVRYSSSQLLSAFLLFFSLENTNQFQTVFTKVYRIFPSIRWEYPATIEWAKRAITLVDFSYLPYCVLMLLIFTGKDFPFRRYITIFLYAIPAYVLVYLYRNRGQYQELIPYTIPVVSYLISLIMLLFSKISFVDKVSTKLIDWCIKLGAVSYGLYIIHFPILLLFKRVNLFSGSWPTFATRFVLFMLTSLFCAYMLEKKLQPRIRDLFFAKS